MKNEPESVAKTVLWELAKAKEAMNRISMDQIAEGLEMNTSTLYNTIRRKVAK